MSLQMETATAVQIIDHLRVSDKDLTLVFADGRLTVNRLLFCAVSGHRSNLNEECDAISVESSVENIFFFSNAHDQDAALWRKKSFM